VLNILQKKKFGYLLTTKERRDSRNSIVHTQLEKEYNRKLTRMQVRYLEKGIRYQAVYDIETSDFNPYQNFIICYVVYVRDIITEKIKKYEYHITKDDIGDAVKNNNFDFDRKLLQNLSKIFKSVNQICGHFSSKFDTPYFRSRCLLTKQSELIPDYQDVMSADTWRMMKTTMKAPRNTLNNLILQATGSSQKTRIDLKYWYLVRFKDSPEWCKAIRFIVDHCRRDVRMTLKALRKIEKFNVMSGASA